MNYRSIADLNNVIRAKISVIPKDVDIIIGIPRSGLLPASVIALLLNKPLITINDLTNNQIDTFSTRAINYSKQYRKAFIVDDSCNTGYSMDRARKFVKEHLSSEVETIFAAVYVTNEAASLVDFYFEICEQPRLFEWNIMNHSAVTASCFDMDGVLNIDPTDEQNDDGPLYEDFIRNAVPLFIPKYEIGAIVTSRLEKYRGLTEEWLHKHGVKYRKLIMLNVPDKATRMRLGLHAPFKTQIYDQSEMALFIESDDSQARYINEFTNKPVYCTGSNMFYNRNNSFDIYKEVKAAARTIEETAYNALTLMYEFRGNADAILESVPIEEAITLFEEYLSGLMSAFEKVYGFMAKDSGLSDWLKTYEDKLKMTLESKDKSEISAFFDLTELNELEYLIDTSIYDVVHKAARLVTNSAWNEEHNKVVKELTTVLIRENINIPGYENEIAFLKKHGELVLYPYDFIYKYRKEDVEVSEDREKNLKFVLHGEKRLYFPPMDDGIIADNYNQLIMEQDIESPHTYFSDDCRFEQGDIFVDVGAAEGIISLDVIEKAKEVYLIECLEDWVKALEATFAPYKDKVHIIPKIAGRSNSDLSITLDSLLSGYHDESMFIKMDAEGMELDILKSSVNVLLNNNCKLSCATYHTRDQEEELRLFFDNLGYTSSPSERYMLFFHGKMVLDNGKYEHIEPPFFRRALVRAHR